uniref:phosphoglycerate dehydrogenase n=1 Tax=Zea mays TaxID=4577 RepID=A0A804R5I2_MAIZE
MPSRQRAHRQHRRRRRARRRAPRRRGAQYRAGRRVAQGKWQRGKYVGVTLVGKTLAVMGFGKVGPEVARRARGLGMDVVAHDPYAAADRARAVGVDLVSFDEAISTADFISLHMPLTPSTAKLFNDETFARMRKGVRIINVSRGGVVDEEALLRALDNGTVSQAALDVFTEEPPPRDSKLVQHENVTVTPHLGASTIEAQEGVALEIAEAVIGALRGDLAATAVNAPMVPAECIASHRFYPSYLHTLSLRRSWAGWWCSWWPLAAGSKASGWSTRPPETLTTWTRDSSAPWSPRASWSRSRAPSSTSSTRTTSRSSEASGSWRRGSSSTARPRSRSTPSRSISPTWSPSSPEPCPTRATSAWRARSGTAARRTSRSSGP